MTHTPAISVVMPVLEADRRFLEIAVASVLRQTLADWELIVVEDPSSRRANDVLRQFEDRRIRHIENRHRTSFAEQLNQGIAAASAPIIARMDADDISEPSRLQTQLDFLNQHHEVDVVGSNLTVIDDKGRELGVRKYPESHEAIARALPRFSPLAHPAVAFRKSTIVAAGGYKGDVCVADYELWNRLYFDGAKMRNLTATLLRYRLHPSAVKARHLKQTIRSTLDVKRQYWRGRMSLRDQLRMLLEHSLLLLPSSLIYRLFLIVSVTRGT